MRFFKASGVSKLSRKDRQGRVNPQHRKLSIQRQCALLGIPRSSYYYEPVPIDDLNLRIMHRMDELYTKWPFLGAKMMVDIIRREIAWVNIKRIKRLMRVMGIQAVYPTPKTSWKNKEHKVYPYLLRNLLIDRPNQVWCADITYIRMPKGFMYLVAIMDWHSRYVLSWQLSNTLDTFFCETALLDALGQNKCEIFNTDQGSQFTSTGFTSILLGKEIQISMDSVGRHLDNIFIERLWRTVKYNDLYLNNYETVDELYAGLDRFFNFYNNERPHQSHKGKTPAEVYFNKEVVRQYQLA
jgi:putative transposase